MVSRYQQRGEARTRLNGVLQRHSLGLRERRDGILARQHACEQGQQLGHGVLADVEPSLRNMQ